MFEIKLCPHARERAKCADCQTVYKAGFGTQWAERACADCEVYFPVSIMAPLSDGRVVCGDCKRRAEIRGVRRAQINLFGQSDLF